VRRCGSHDMHVTAVHRRNDYQWEKHRGSCCTHVNVKRAPLALCPSEACPHKVAFGGTESQLTLSGDNTHRDLNACNAATSSVMRVKGRALVGQVEQLANGRCGSFQQGLRNRRLHRWCQTSRQSLDQHRRLQTQQKQVPSCESPQPSSETANGAPATAVVG